MVGKAAAAAAGEKKRGRPRKKSEGRPPLALAPAPAAPRRPVAAGPSPPARRSDRPRRAPRMDDYADYRDYEDDLYWEQLSTDEEAEKEAQEDDEESEVGAERGRREKKFRLLQKLPHHHHGAPPSSASSSFEHDGAGGRGSLKKGRSCGTGRGGADGDHCEDGGDLRRDGSGSGSEGEEGRGRHAALECDQSTAGKEMGEFPLSIRLPDKKMLEAILDKLQKCAWFPLRVFDICTFVALLLAVYSLFSLQLLCCRKDTYGVYAEPVDPEELPDYHDIIKHPMDFATIRKKLATGVYCHLEHFESDVFLVCTNAMQYNAPDTIYFRQARSIQDLATKKFQKIRFDNQDALRSEQKIRSNSVTTKLGKRSLGKSAHTPGGSDVSLPATCISTEDASSSGHKAEQAYPIGQPVSVNGVIDDSLTCENKSEKGDEHSAKSAPVKLEKKLDVLYEDRRTTYDMSKEQPMIQPDPLFTTFEDEQKNLVGLDAEYSYARSLARFAGTLGPVAWKIASEKIEKALPEGTKFGPGWVGEYEPLPMPVLSFKSQSIDRTNFLCKIEYQERNEDEMQSAARKGLQTAAGVPLNSSAMGMSQMTNGKANHSELPFMFGFNKGFQSTILNTTLLQGKPLDAVSAIDYKAKVGTGALSFKSESVVDIPVQRYEQCSKVTPCRVPEMISGSRSNKESEKQPELVSYQSENTSSRMDTRDLSGGKDLGNIGGKGFMAIHQARAVGNFSSHSGKEQANGDPIQLVSMQRRKLVNDNAKQLMSTVPSPRGNYIAAVPTRTPVWMPVGRSSKQNVPEASDNLKRQAGGVSLKNFSSESVTSVSGFHENNWKNLTPSVHQLPCQTAGVESWVQGNGLPVFPQVTATEQSRYRGQTPTQVQKPKKDTCPPDLNITFHAPKSPVLQSSGILVDSQQPDLALQL
ncbi:hypothetical protein Taro_037686 [Colocasia esculenta]|uniref:Bromo domain-containing protein n=1 Tax=Colocasia esculenta TaxID=4460 RepID=A0A843W4T1_COLES|nr:hypothetical protein [Colocasia esculenta]